MQKTKRIFNNRPLCFFALSFAVGLIVTEAIYPSSALYRLIPLLLSLISAAILFFVKPTKKFAYIAIAVALGVLCMGGACDVYQSRAVDGSDTALQGRVAGEIVVDDNVAFFTLDDAKTADGELPGKVQVRVGGLTDPDFGSGDIVLLSGKLSFYEHERFDTFYSWRASNFLYYDFDCANLKKIADGKDPFPENARTAIKKVCYDNLGEDGGVCIALILGDKDGMDSSFYEDVKASGLAHVLAVSGLHVTTLATLLYFLLKKLKVNPKVSFSVVAALTFFYVVLCSFTPSAIRAFVMVCALNFANAFGLKGDKLSSLAFAAIILLIVNPLNIMHVGFLLSFFAVLGLFLFGSSFERFFRRALLLKDDRGGLLFKTAANGGEGMMKVALVGARERAGGYIASALAVCFSANVMTLPLTAFFFEEVSTLFFLSNLIMVPYLMFIYLFLLINVAFALITTFGGTLIIVKILLVPFKLWVAALSSIPFAVVHIAVGVVAIVCWEFSAVLLSPYVFLKRRTKTVVTLSWLAVCLAAAAIAVAI